jgi:hypothetical protein
MRTKALLMAAAALAAGIVTSNAQVYSQNIVGYVSVSLTNATLQCISPVLDLDGTGTNNTVSTVFPGAAVNDNVYVFTGAGYDQLIFKKSGHSPNFVTNWVVGATTTNNYPINPGQGVFYLAAANETNTEVGTVLQGTNLVNSFVPAANGINLIASIAPISGGLTSVLGYQPNVNDNVYIFTGSGYNQFIYKKSGHSPNFVTNWVLGATTQEPVVSAGQGFFLAPAAAAAWSENFVVNP